MIKQRTAAAALCLAALAVPALAEQKCSIQAAAREAAPKTPWIGKGNWLAPENLRYGQGHLPHFMPAVRVAPREPAAALPRADQLLDLERLTAADPIDGEERSLAFLLDTRLYADGVLVLRDGAILAEAYRHGLSAAEPRLVGSATRPVVAMLAAMSTAKGKLRLEHALSRHLPELATIAELRKISLHRLLNRPDAFHWEEADLQGWKHASGWDSDQPGESLRAWAKAAPWRLAAADQPGTPDGPEGQLAVWAVERAWKRPLPAVFCERLFAAAGAEHPAYWAASPEGDALADGLALSLPDFARLGNALLKSRGNFRGLLPTWFADAVASAGGSLEARATSPAGFPRGTQARYGFLILPGAPHRAAAVGSQGNSLFIDFERRLVVAVFASYPAERSPRMAETLQRVWEAIDAAAGQAAR